MIIIIIIHSCITHTGNNNINASNKCWWLAMNRSTMIADLLQKKTIKIWFDFFFELNSTCNISINSRNFYFVCVWKTKNYLYKEGSKQIPVFDLFFWQKSHTHYYPTKLFKWIIFIIIQNFNPFSILTIIMMVIIENNEKKIFKLNQKSYLCEQPWK